MICRLSPFTSLITERNRLKVSVCFFIIIHNVTTPSMLSLRLCVKAFPVLLWGLLKRNQVPLLFQPQKWCLVLQKKCQPFIVCITRNTMHCKRRGTRFWTVFKRQSQISYRLQLKPQAPQQSAFYKNLCRL